MKIITFRYYDPSLNTRLGIATRTLMQSAKNFGIESQPVWSRETDTMDFGNLLRMARLQTDHSYFVWCHTDVVLTKDPFEGLPEGRNYGFHRTERPSGDINYGVDMYRIDNELWDNVLVKDLPKLVLGGSHMDWWLSRACQKYGEYENLTGYIDHPSHERTATSAGSNDDGKSNIENFNAWADRHGISKK